MELVNERRPYRPPFVIGIVSTVSSGSAGAIRRGEELMNRIKFVTRMRKQTPPSVLNINPNMPPISQLNIQRQLTAEGLDITLQRRDFHFVATLFQIGN